jgi:ribosomal-protein-alanine N-acetyltransferase
MHDYIYEENLETERLVTRKLVYNDFKIWTEFFEDKESVKFLPDYSLPTSESRAINWIERQLKRYENKQFGLQALTEKTTGQFVGMCGLISQEVEGIKELEVGYHLLKQYRGKGYAAEAAKFFRNYAFINELSPSVISIIHTGNIRSQGVAAKNGMSRERQCTWNNIDVYIYRVSNRESLH